MRSPETFLAAHRFGLGAGPEDLAAIGRNPRDWVRRQIGHSDPRSTEVFRDLMTGPQAAQALTARLTALRSADSPQQADRAQNQMRRMTRDGLLAEASARLDLALITDTPVTERLVHFWSNHLAVSGTKPAVNQLAGAYEREAIRPHVYGRFEDMLLASARHPAMLFYLDNLLSIGPQSRAGRLTGRGLNENYARELLELHTLGVAGGYSQTDVEALAKILTGWSIQRQNEADAGQFRFFANRHEPGEKTVLGRRYAAGEAAGIAVIRDLARHPATADHIAGKLACHFIADDPPPRAVEALARTWRQSNGDLRAVSETLVALPDAWATPPDQPPRKVKTPQDYVIALHRAVGATATDRLAVGALRELGQMPFQPPSPQGWPDRADAWLGPQALMNRVSLAERIAARLPGGMDVDGFAAALIGPIARPETLQWISRAPSPAAGLALTFASAEFQSR